MIRISMPTALLVLALASPAVGQGWLQVASMPGTGRHHPVTFTLDGYGYVATGTTAGAGYTDDFYRYDPSTNTWAILADFPGPARSYAYGGAFNGKAYLGFGVGTVFLSDLWEFDPVAGWTQLASLPTAGRTHPAFVITDDGKIFVGMGGAQGGNLRDWWEYDIASNTWTQRATLPGATRHHPFYFNIGNVPYVGFGHGAAIYKDFYRFNRESNTWTRMTDFPGEGRVAGTQFSWQNKGYILSGEGEDHQKLDTGEFWEYHQVDDRWIQLTPHPGSGRWAPGTLLIGNTLYFMAGTSTVQMEHDAWTFDMTTTAGAAEPIRLDASLTPYPNPLIGQRQFRFHSAGATDLAAIHLLSADGREIAELADRSGAIQLPQDLASGQYFLSFSMKDGMRQTRTVTVLR
jgi:N-acetylneuraminic acid mutarotase